MRVLHIFAGLGILGKFGIGQVCLWLEGHLHYSAFRHFKLRSRLYHDEIADQADEDRQGMRVGTDMYRIVEAAALQHLPFSFPAYCKRNRPR